MFKIQSSKFRSTQRGAFIAKRRKNVQSSMLNIEIDNGSGFCFGVTTAIRKAEEELAKGGTLYCLGDIVHNGMECERLRNM